MTRYSIIDGQQRLISCYVLLLLLKQKIIDLEEKYQMHHNLSDSYQETVRNRQDTNNTYNEMKVNSPRNDSWSICKLLHKPENIHVHESIKRVDSERLEKYIKYVNSKLKQHASDIDAAERLIEALLKNLRIVCIYLPPQFDEQIIFETLNAFGVPLTPSELICNYLFSKIHHDVNDRNELESIHKVKWLSIEQSIEGEREAISNNEEYTEFESFIRYTMSIDQEKMLPKSSSTRHNSMYYKIKSQYRDSKSAVSALDSIVKYSKYFRYYINPKDIDDSIDISIKHKIEDLSKIGVHSTIPFVMCLLDRLQSNMIDSSVCDAVLSILTSLLVRNRIINSNPKYDVFFPNLMSVLERNSKDIKQGFIDVIKKHNFFVTDDDFRHGFIEQQLYRKSDKKFPLYILVSLDKHMTKHGQTVDYSKFSQIEHVMPNQSYESMSKEWKAELGEITVEQNSVLETTIHTVGNLTILGRGNHAIQDKHISDKIKHIAYTQATPPLTQHVIDTYNKATKWNIATIQHRSSKLADFACSIWDWR